QTLAMFFYIPMQVADIFHMGIDICQLGMDQRKANILAREIGPQLGWWKPVCVHHHLLMGLQGPKKMGFEEDELMDLEVSSKMSKSKPETCIYVVDPPNTIRDKILNAYCPPRVVEDNPIIDICRNILLRCEEDSLHVDRPAEFGGPITFWNIRELEEAYRAGKLHPLDIKKAVAEKLIELLEPCRRHFSSGKSKELLDRIRNYTVTR
ncbi:MAG: tyrosine--tRNA ligase, partial [Thermoproteota archaeon]